MKTKIIFFLGMTLIACGNSSLLDFTNAVNIAAGDAAGTALSGTFATLLEIKSNSCDAADLETPTKGQSVPVDVEVTQTDGVVVFDKIDVTIRGGANFAGDFQVGGADIVDRGNGTQNILRVVSVNGKFKDPNQFSGTGKERLTGQLNNKDIDCEYTFDVSGVRR